MVVAYISHPDCLLHEMGSHHPEDPSRLNFINDRLIASGLAMVLQQYDAPEATREQILRAHDGEYLDRLLAASPLDDLLWVDEDTAMNRYTTRAMLHAAGAGVMAVDMLMDGRASQVFCGVRPPGHHAERGRAMGFCFLNNIAIAALHALDAHGLERVAIADFDVHHGNGTEDIVAGDQRILFLSTFEHPSYPHSGITTSTPNIVNVPLPAGTDGTSYREAVKTNWLPALEDFAPQMVLISAGFDGHQADIMAHFNLREMDYTWITAKLKAVADHHAGGRVVSMLEGGYHLHALARAVEAHIKVFLDS
ncbi:MAG: deacetylase [marine bacterium B5-7]|nr:MAG: deacetylase [marine bacterium B5-7]